MQVNVSLRSLKASNVDGVPLTPTELETGEATRFWDEDMLKRATEWSEEAPVAASGSIRRSLAQDFEAQYSMQEKALQMASGSDLEEPEDMGLEEPEQLVPLGPEEAPVDAPQEADDASEDLLDTEAEPCERDAQRTLRSEKQEAQRRRGRGGGRGRGKRSPVCDGAAKKAKPAAKKAAAKKVLKRPAAKQLQPEEPMAEPVMEEPPMAEEPMAEEPMAERLTEEPDDAEDEPSPPAEVTRGRGRGRGKKPKLVVTEEQKRVCKELIQAGRSHKHEIYWSRKTIGVRMKSGTQVWSMSFPNLKVGIIVANEVNLLERGVSIHGALIHDSIMAYRAELEEKHIALGVSLDDPQLTSMDLFWRRSCVMPRGSKRLLNLASRSDEGSGVASAADGPPRALVQSAYRFGELFAGAANVTSAMYWFAPLGNVEKDWVARGNLMAARTYTTDFGNALADLLPNMHEGIRGLRVANDHAGMRASNLLIAMSADQQLWEEADMTSVVRLVQNISATPVCGCTDVVQEYKKRRAEAGAEAMAPSVRPKMEVDEMGRPPLPPPPFPAPPPKAKATLAWGRVVPPPKVRDVASCGQVVPPARGQEEAPATPAGKSPPLKKSRTEVGVSKRGGPEVSADVDTQVADAGAVPKLPGGAMMKEQAPFPRSRPRQAPQVHAGGQQEEARAPMPPQYPPPGHQQMTAPSPEKLPGGPQQMPAPSPQKLPAGPQQTPAPPPQKLPGEPQQMRAPPPQQAPGGQQMTAPPQQAPGGPQMTAPLPAPGGPQMTAPPLQQLAGGPQMTAPPLQQLPGGQQMVAGGHPRSPQRSPTGQPVVFTPPHMSGMAGGGSMPAVPMGNVPAMPRRVPTGPTEVEMMQQVNEATIRQLSMQLAAAQQQASMMKQKEAALQKQQQQQQQQQQQHDLPQKSPTRVTTEPLPCVDSQTQPGQAASASVPQMPKMQEPRQQPTVTMQQQVQPTVQKPALQQPMMHPTMLQPMPQPTVPQPMPQPTVPQPMPQPTMLQPGVMQPMLQPTMPQGSMPTMMQSMPQGSMPTMMQPMPQPSVPQGSMLQHTMPQPTLLQPPTPTFVPSPALPMAAGDDHAAIETGYKTMMSLSGVTGRLPPNIMDMYVRLVEECARMKGGVSGSPTNRVPAQAPQGVAAAQSAAVSQAPESVTAAQSAAVSPSHASNTVVDVDAATTSPSEELSADGVPPAPKEEGGTDRKNYATQIDAQKQAVVPDATTQQPDTQYVNGKSIKNKNQGVRDEILQKWNAGGYVRQKLLKDFIEKCYQPHSAGNARLEAVFKIRQLSRDWRKSLKGFEWLTEKEMIALGWPEKKVQGAVAHCDKQKLYKKQGSERLRELESMMEDAGTFDESFDMSLGVGDLMLEDEDDKVQAGMLEQKNCPPGRGGKAPGGPGERSDLKRLQDENGCLNGLYQRLCDQELKMKNGTKKDFNDTTQQIKDSLLRFANAANACKSYLRKQAPKGKAKAKSTAKREEGANVVESVLQTYLVFRCIVRAAIYQQSWGPVMKAGLASGLHCFFYAAMLADEYKAQVVPIQTYEQDDNIGFGSGNRTLDSLMQHFVEDAKECYFNGVPSRNGRFYIVLIRLEGPLAGDQRLLWKRPGCHGVLCMIYREVRKGSDARLLTKWLADYLSRPWCFDVMTEHVFDMITALDDFHRLCYAQCDRIWMSAVEMKRARALLSRFIFSYSMAAQKSHAKGMLFFNITPKYHYLLHMEHDLRISMGHSWGLNPACFATQMDEDYMGVSSRMSRAAHPLGAARRTAQ
ncbi:unnamed protein product, partial [Symbiodinium microadriaticum]